MLNYLDKFSLKDKVVFVVGGAGLLGAESSKALASAGAKTVILDIDRKKAEVIEKEIIGSGYEAYFEYFDVTRSEGLKRNFKKLIKRYGPPYSLVNTAYPHTKDWGRGDESLNLSSLRKNIDIQLTSCAWISWEVAITMRRFKIKGSIVNLGSIYGVVANDFTIYENTPMTGVFAYAPIKGGIISLTRYIASYFGKDGIRINTLCPGGIFNNQNKAFITKYEKRVPLKKMGRPDQIASVVLFLASEAASYITGATIMVDGGWTIV